MNDLVGQTLGRYRLEALIGRGATGEVYRGAHLYRAQLAAIKILRASLTAGPESSARFLDEMQRVAALRHRNIVTIDEFGAQDGRCYVAMELVTAGSLRMVLRRLPPGGPLPLAVALDLAHQAADGLAYAHAHGTVHKDLKPSNLLLNDLRGQSTAGSATYGLKITDFGLVRLAQSANSMAIAGAMLGVGVMLGSPAYMSPEECQGQRLDGRSDLYSLGIVLYEMLMGHPPFAASTLREAYQEHLHAAPPPPREAVPGLPAEVEAIVLRCLAKRPDDRYATADELAAALSAAQRLV